jgi:hypothetical protein
MTQRKKNKLEPTIKIAKIKVLLLELCGQIASAGGVAGLPKDWLDDMFKAIEDI